MPHTGMAVTTDIANTRDIHPRNKQDVGKRLALWALAETYGKTGFEYSGPLFESANFKRRRAIVSFTHADGLKSSDGNPLSHWELAGEDGKFVSAKAVIRRNKVVVTSDEVEAPKAVRFGFHQEAEPNLSNSAELPASPFTTADLTK